MALSRLPYDPDDPPPHLAIAGDNEELEIAYQVDCQRRWSVEQRIAALEQLSAPIEALRDAHDPCPHPHVIARI